jgi:hypothetical protein
VDLILDGDRISRIDRAKHGVTLFRLPDFCISHGSTQVATAAKSHGPWHGTEPSPHTLHPADDRYSPFILAAMVDSAIERLLSATSLYDCPWLHSASQGTFGLTPEARMQSPTIIAGLRGVATSLWLHFVASPQRVPVSGYRRRGRTVVNVIYRLPPSRRMLQPR